MPRAARYTATATLLLAIYWILAVSASPRIGITADEGIHLTAGLSYWKSNDYRLQPENGTLAMRLAALPVLLDEDAARPPDASAWASADVNAISRDLLFSDPIIGRHYLHAGRMMIALLGVFALWMTWRWSRALFGETGGILTLLAGAFSPTFLAHGALTTSDMAITAAFLAGVSSFWKLLHRITIGRLLFASLAAAAALLAKMSGVLLAPMLFILMAVRCCGRQQLPLHIGCWKIRLRSRKAVIMGVITTGVATATLALTGLWAGYGFRYSAFNQDTAGRFMLSWDQLLEKAPLPAAADSEDPLAPAAPVLRPGAATQLIEWAHDHRLLPEAFLWGFAHTYKFSRSRPAFLDGEVRTDGWRRFFPEAFWLKTTPGLLILFSAGVSYILIHNRGAKRRYRHRMAPLISLFIVYWLMAISSHLNIGHRHLLPIYPVVFVLAGATVCWRVALPSGSKKYLTAAVITAALAHVSAAMMVRPNYLSYFQPAGGGADGGWIHLVDSSYDWGQGLPALQDWVRDLRTSGNHEPVYLTYFGADEPDAYDLDAIRFGDEVSDHGPRFYPAIPEGGWFAISATHFQKVYLRIRGPWNDRLENLYWQTRSELAACTPEIVRTSPEKCALAAANLELLSYGRLRHFIGAKKPNRIIGGSILIFHLNSAEVSLALNQPLAKKTYQSE